MFQYFKKFGDKPCCFTDLKVFVDLLPPNQYTKVRKDKEVEAGTAALVCTLVSILKYQYLWIILKDWKHPIFTFCLKFRKLFALQKK